jgi:hypothetical protein
MTVFPQSGCYLWPRRTIFVLIVLLVFVVALVAAGTAPLLAVGIVIAAAVVAVTGNVPTVAIPGL